MSKMVSDKSTTLNDCIKRLFAERLNLEVPSLDTKLIDEGYLDSLLFIDLLMALEQEFGLAIELDQVDFDNFETLNAIADFVATHSDGATDA